ncbi:IniB N-terminal domain-containing protein [Microbacterium sp. 1P10UB]|uniref:IniB N-terminal domain-containing protein n=1 Tax=unclassified Microbacterium TaxID=2609290 RepID=UPI00399F68FC
MSMTLATVADALIEFILSLLKDPVAAAEFEDDPQAALSRCGLNNVSAHDVQSVAPVIIERTSVVQVPVGVTKVVHVDGGGSGGNGGGGGGRGPGQEPNAVVREIKNITNHFQTVDDRDTIVDQSVNQNIWAEGDVTQNFDNDAVVASGDDTIAAGGSVDIDQTKDESTTINAGDDVNMGNDTDVTIIDDSFDEDTDTDTTTDGSTTIDTDGSYNDGSTTVDTEGSNNDESTTVDTDDSFNDGSTTVDVDGSFTDESTTVVAADADAAMIVEETPLDDSPAEEAPAEEAAPAEEFAEAAPVEDPYADAAAQYTEADVSTESDDYASDDAMLPDTAAAGEEY